MNAVHEFCQVSLGSDDCDCCGTTFNRLHVAYENGRYEFRLDAGCMGGAQFFYEDKDVFLTRAEEERDYFIRNFPEHTTEFEAMIRSVTAHVPEVTEHEDDEDDEMSDEEAAEYVAELVAQLRRDNKEVPRWML